MSTTMELFHEYMQQPAYVISAMRFEQWRQAREFCEGRMTFTQAFEAAARTRDETRRQLGWYLR